MSDTITVTLEPREATALKGVLAAAADHPDFTLSPDHEKARAKLAQALDSPQPSRGDEVLRPASRAHIALEAAVLQCLEAEVWPETITRFVREALEGAGHRQPSREQRLEEALRGIEVVAATDGVAGCIRVARAALSPDSKEAER